MVGPCSKENERLISEEGERKKIIRRKSRQIINGNGPVTPE